jgi:hypothetical protein
VLRLIRSLGGLTSRRWRGSKGDFWVEAPSHTDLTVDSKNKKLKGKGASSRSTNPVNCVLLGCPLLKYFHRVMKYHRTAHVVDNWCPDGGLARTSW